MGKRLKSKPGKSTGKSLKAALVRHQSTPKVKTATPKTEPTKPKAVASQPEQLNKTFIPFNENETVMLVGEGDFSFAVSCTNCGYIKPSKLIVTSYDASPNELVLKYPKTFPQNNEFLIAQGVQIHYRVDATDMIRSMKLKKLKGFPKLDYIVFNFPHTGRGMKDMDRNIRDHQVLVLGYMKSSLEVFQLLNNQKDKTDLNILGREAKEPKIVLSVFEGEPYDSWSIKSLSKTLGLKVERSGKFQWSAFEGYMHKRTNSEINTTKVANERNARIYVFEKFKRQQKKKVEDSDDE